MKETPFYTDALNEVNINNIITNEKPELIVLFGLNDLGKTTFFVHSIICLESVVKWLIISLSIPTPLQALSAGFFYVNVVKMVESNTNRTLRSENPFLTLHMEHETTNKKPFYCVI